MRYPNNPSYLLFLTAKNSSGRITGLGINPNLLIQIHPSWHFDLSHCLLSLRDGIIDNDFAYTLTSLKISYVVVDKDFRFESSLDNLFESYNIIFSDNDIEVLHIEKYSSSLVSGERLSNQCSRALESAQWLFLKCLLLLSYHVIEHLLRLLLSSKSAFGV